MAWLEKEKRQNTKWWVLLTNWLNQIFASIGLVLKVHLVVKVINSILLNISIIFLQQIFGSKLLMILLWNNYWNYYFFINISNNNLLLKIYCKNIVNITFLKFNIKNISFSPKVTFLLVIQKTKVWINQKRCS